MKKMILTKIMDAIVILLIIAGIGMIAGTEGSISICGFLVTVAAAFGLFALAGLIARASHPELRKNSN